jgi:diguanylate cyclase (GGDEF)-like protein/PAS domain S-box-containing protein
MPDERPVDNQDLDHPTMVQSALTRAILEAALDCIITIDHEGLVHEWNPAAERTFGYSRHEAMGREMATMIIPPETRDAHRRGIAHYLATGDGPVLGRRIEVDAMRADGSTFPVELAINHVDLPGSPFFTAYVREISDRVAAERQLRDAEERYRTLVERLPAIVYVADFGSQGTWRYVSPQIEAVLGFTPSDWLADAGLWARQIHPADRELVLAAEEGLRSHGVEQSATWEYRMLARDGGVVWIRDEAMLIPGDGDRVPQMRGVMIDITDRKHLEERLTHQAFYDGLTGLPNRALFIERLDHALARSMRRPDDIVAVLFLDLDDFKVVNDTLGHTAGDQLLQTVSRRLVDASRADDTAARLGGDEFTILLEDVSSVDEVARYAARILERITAPIDVGEHRLTVSASIGIGISGSGETGAEDLVRQADVAMYRAKQNGKAGFEIYDERMSVEAWRRLEMEAELRRAVEGGQLQVYYQPIYDLTSGGVVEVEALVRWQHPERGLLQPVDFIPFAESMGLILDIDRYVLEAACRQVRAWGIGKGPTAELTLCVNLSAREFRVPGIVESVADILRGTGLPAERLKLEITESVVMIESDLTESIIRGLAGLGVRIAIDDFGVGYSALGYLRRLSADTLKIDRSFVAGLGTSREDAAIVSATIALARALDLSVTAEGIETPAQAALLGELGCDRGQGFLFSPPVPADRLADLLAGSAVAGAPRLAAR